MFECRITREYGLQWVICEGRIDAISAKEVEKTLRALIREGERLIGADFERVNYISSAGLRVFLQAQKQLSRVGGEIILSAVPPFVLSIFHMSGFPKLFRFTNTRKEAGRLPEVLPESSGVISMETEGVRLRYMEKSAGVGCFRIFGDQKKLSVSGYDKDDVVEVQSKEVVFGAGLGTVGSQYDRYKNFFGEAMVINNHLFFYPAVKNPAADYMLCSDEESVFAYNFLHGFGFDGPFRYVLSFEGIEGSVELGYLVNTLFKLSSAEVLGVVLFGESKGIWGMHLKKVPIMENRPENGKSIFDSENFSDWLSFPIEADDFNHVVAGIGVAVRHKDTGAPNVLEVMAEQDNFHFHGGVFSKEPLSRKPEKFEAELQRVLTELPVYKVQHLLARSRFSHGMAGIIELEV